MGQKSSAHEVLVGTPKGKGPFRRPISRWEDDIKIILRIRTGRCRLDSSGSG
jgi:hypothetical protein